MAKKAGFRLLAEADVKITALVEDPDNANTHDERNVEAIKDSLAKFGQPERLIVRKADGVVFAGNGRLLAMRDLKWATARVQYVDGSDEECRAYAIAANRTSELSRRDPQKLLENLETLDPELLKASGYDVDDMAELTEALAPESFQAIDESLPETNAEDPTKTRCPQCGWAFHPGAKDATVEARKAKEAKKAAKKPKAKA